MPTTGARSHVNAGRRSTSLTISDASITNVNASFSFAGTLTTTSTGAGTFVISHITWDKNGTHYDCTGAPTNWTAKLGG